MGPNTGELSGIARAKAGAFLIRLPASARWRAGRTMAHL